MFGRVLAFSVLLLASLSPTTYARAAELQGAFCHAVTAAGAPSPPAEAYACDGEPRAYSDGRLWLRAPIAGDGTERRLSVVVRTSRFEHVEAQFVYADGTRSAGGVDAGAFADKWRIGGQIVLPAPARDTAPTDVELAVDGLAAYDLFAARVVPMVEADRTLGFMAFVLGGATALLTISALYNLLLAFAVRSAAVVWQAGWAICLVLYTLFWSQLILLVAPGLAGPISSRLMTASAALAIGCATLCGLAMIDRSHTPIWLRRAVTGIAALTVGCALVATVAPPLLVQVFAIILGPLVLVSLIVSWLFTIWGWRSGSTAARDFTLSWALPMIGLALTELGGLKQAFYGSGPYVTIIVASALQTVSLSVATTIRLAALRRERDAARAEKSQLEVLVERDPLTSLLNRRGFMKRAERLFAKANGELQLILIDLDRFKAINDDFGHNAGDVVLRAVGHCIDKKLPAHSFAGRIGGEEFGMCLSGSDHDAMRLASEVRAGIEALDLDALDGAAGKRGVTASFGISRSGKRADFVDVYREADRALYISKRAGRNRVTHAALLAETAESEPVAAI